MVFYLFFLSFVVSVNIRYLLVAGRIVYFPIHFKSTLMPIHCCIAVVFTQTFTYTKRHTHARITSPKRTWYLYREDRLKFIAFFKCAKRFAQRHVCTQSIVNIFCNSRIKAGSRSKILLDDVEYYEVWGTKQKLL